MECKIHFEQSLDMHVYAGRKVVHMIRNTLSNKLNNAQM